MGRERTLQPESAQAQSGGYTAGWYDYQRSLVCLKSWGADGDMEIERIPFCWYLYVRAADYEEVNCRDLDRMLDRVEPCDDGVHVRCYLESRKREDREALVEWFRDRGIEPLEGDVDPFSRYMADNPVRFARPRILFYDVETDPRKGFVVGKHGMEPHPNSRILSLAWAGPDGKVDVEVADAYTDAAEARVLTTFLEAVADADVLVAWNGDAFDEILLRARCKALRRAMGFEPEWRLVNFLDMMLLFKHPYYGFGRDPEATGVKTSYSLDNIARTVLGETKLEGFPGAKMYDLWKKDRGRVAEYNAQDVRLMAKLEMTKGYIAGFEIICHTCNRFVSSRGLHAGYTGDGFMLRYGAARGFRFRTKHNASEKDDAEQFEGAVIFEPKPGLHRDVCAVDFSALYPSILRTFNISPETKVVGARVASPGAAPCAQAMNGACFKTDKDGILSSVVATCTNNRKPWKRKAGALKLMGKEDGPEYAEAVRMGNSWKVVQNSLVGLLGSAYTRIYDRDCFEAVTVTGQAIIKRVAALAEERGLPVLYADTDSNYLRCSEQQAREFMAHVAAEMDKWAVGRGGKPGFIRLDLDAQYDRIFWSRKADGTPAKKRYAGRKTTGKVDIKGLEIMRGDGCRYRREFQREVINYILFDDDPQPGTVETMCKRHATAIYSGKLAAADLTITVGLNKLPDEYKTETPQVRVARKMLAARREVFVGMKIPYIVVGLLAPAGKGKAAKPDAVHADDYQGVYDADYYWRDQCYPAVHRILTSVFPDADATWKALEKWRPEDDGQSSIFEQATGRHVLSKLMLQLEEQDAGRLGELAETMKRVAAAAAKAAPCAAQVPVWLLMPDGTELDTRIASCGPRAMVAAVEGLLKHRAYYGVDCDLGAR